MDYAKEKSVYEFAVSIWKEQANKYELHDESNPLYISMKDAYKRMKSVKGVLDKLKAQTKRNADSDASGDDRSSRSRSVSPEKPKLKKYWSQSKQKFVFASLSRSPSPNPKEKPKK